MIDGIKKLQLNAMWYIEANHLEGETDYGEAKIL